MSIGRWCVALLCLGLAGPVAAQSVPPGKPAPDIIVNGLVNGAKPVKGSWKRAESDHVIVFSQGSDEELRRVTRNLDRLYNLMSHIYRRGATTDDTAKLQVTLVGSSADYRALALANLRSTEGPYVTAFTEQAYYDPREDGAQIAVARSSQIVELNTNRAYNLDCDDQLEGGVSDCVSSYHEPAVQTWQQRLYAAYARHFIQTYAPVAYPRWYLDGVGILFSTLTVRLDGSMNYGKPPENYLGVFRAYGDLDVAKVLSGHYLDAAPGKIGWTPYHAWLLTHYFVFSPLKPERSQQFKAYMTAVSQGQPLAEAVKAFGDMGALGRELRGYLTRDKLFARTAPPPTVPDDPIVTLLSPAASAIVTARVELGSRLAGGDADSMARRDGWVAQLREKLAGLPYDTEAQLLLTEVECRAGKIADCLADAGRVLAKSPDNVRALAWKGVAMTDYAISGGPVDRAGRLILARDAIERAIALDDLAPLPRIALFQSFTKAGEPVPEAVLLGMATVVRDVPAAPAPRLYLAQELIRQGKADVARRLLRTVLWGPYDSPERVAATALVASAGQ